jgi:XTP/dITP diphosphohydrolase
MRELRPLFAAAGVSFVDLREAAIGEVPEEATLERFDTFEDNALAKARYFFGRSGGVPTIADDSGLEVQALNGRPGVRSKRWSGRDDLVGQALDDANNAALLAALRGSDDWRARYVCVAAYVDATRTIVRRGEATGRIVAEGRGGNGFGYDPHFESGELGRTFGEASLEEKQRVSHRGRAFGELLRALGVTARARVGDREAAPVDPDAGAG